ncbi:MAG TPA: vWA domain-containing protein, partial [Kofleriaceae bacterium]
MPLRQPLVTYGVGTAAAATITVAALLQPWRGAELPGLPNSGHEAPVTAPRRAVDVVFAVDTTGSMGGLLEGAKRTVWSIATHIRRTDPDAELRIGLVAYRDIGDDYVTRDFALTTDLDAVFAELSGYRAAGGGDTPEDVAAALDDTLHKMRWRTDARKLVFLVGDAPPADRGDVPAFDVLAREAGDKQIVLNTIRCGWDPDTERAWQAIAALGHGQFSTVEQDGGVQQVATPYDERLARLSAQVDSTAVIVGDDGERAVYERNL